MVSTWPCLWRKPLHPEVVFRSTDETWSPTVAYPGVCGSVDAVVESAFGESRSACGERLAWRPEKERKSRWSCKVRGAVRCGTVSYTPSVFIETQTPSKLLKRCRVYCNSDPTHRSRTRILFITSSSVVTPAMPSLGSLVRGLTSDPSSDFVFLASFLCGQHVVAPIEIKPREQGTR